MSSHADPDLANTALYFAYHRTRATSRTDVLPAGRLRIAWQSGSVRLGAGLGHTARVAEGNERFYALQRAGADWVGNPALEPARNTGVELSAGWTRAGAAVNVQLFASRIDGYLTVYDQDRVEPGTGVVNAMARTYANTDAVLTGGELTASAPLGSRVFLSGDVSYARGSQDGVPALAIAASPLAEMPAPRSRVRLRFDDGRLFAVVEELATGDQRRVDASLGEVPTPGAAVTNLPRESAGDLSPSPSVSRTSSTVTTSMPFRTCAIRFAPA